MQSGETIYADLDATRWNLIICGDNELKKSAIAELNKNLNESLNVVLVEKQTYPCKFLLLRPDWHISSVSNELHNIINWILNVLKKEEVTIK